MKLDADLVDQMKAIDDWLIGALAEARRTRGSDSAVLLRHMNVLRERYADQRDAIVGEQTKRSKER